MKSKRKLDAKAIKQFFIDHTEKIVIGAVCLLFLYFTYSAVMLQANDSYKKVPDNLIEAVKAADRTIRTGPTTKTVVWEAPIPPYAQHIEHFKVALDIKQYPSGPAWQPILLPQRNPRGTPAVIPVEELRAVAGRGALSGKDNGAGTVGQRWVVVTGLVPYAKQLAEYKSNFETSSFPTDHDVPEYVGFLVQRAEVAPGTAGEPNWEKAVTICNENFLGRQLDKWTGAGAEVVNAKYIYPGLTSQLPPRATGDWGDEVAHPSEIKVIPLEERGQLQGGTGAGQPPASIRGGGPRVRMPPRGEGSYGRDPRRPQQGTVRPGSDQGGSGLFDDIPDAAKDAGANKPVNEAARNSFPLSAALFRLRRGAGQAVRLSGLPVAEKPQ